MVFKKLKHPCALGESSLSIGRVDLLSYAQELDLKLMFVSKFPARSWKVLGILEFKYESLVRGQ